MYRLLLFLVPLVFLAAPVAAQQVAATAEDPRIFPLGTIIPKVVTLAKPDLSYALFLPSQYSPKKQWPIVYAFDLGAPPQMRISRVCLA